MFRRMQPLWSVMGWELFRYKEMRFSKFMIIGIALFFALGAWSWAITCRMPVPACWV